MDLIDKDHDNLQVMLNKLCKDSERYGMRINKDKTKAMTFQRSVQSDELTLSIHGTQVEYVQNFIYLGSMISWNNDCTLDIIRRIQLATVVYAGFRTIGRIRTLLWTSS